jgi:hypothetical protein
MTTATSAQASKRTGAFASLWAMLRLIVTLMLKPGGEAEARARMAEAERDAALAILRTVLDAEPGCRLTIDDFEIVSLYDARGRFDPDFRLKPHVRAANRRAWREHYLQLRHACLTRRLTNFGCTLLGMRDALRRASRRNRVARMGCRSRRIAARVRIAAPAALPALIPP